MAYGIEERILVTPEAICSGAELEGEVPTQFQFLLQTLRHIFEEALNSYVNEKMNSLAPVIE